MVPCWAAGILSLLTLAAAHPSQQSSAASQQSSAASQQPSAAFQELSAVSQQPSAADQLSALLGPVVEGAVSRAQSGCQLAQLAGRLERLQGGAEAGQRALAELTRQQVRLDTVVHDVAALQLVVLAGGGRGATTVPGGVCRSPQPEPESESEPETKPKLRPKPKLEQESGPNPKKEPEQEQAEEPEPEQKQVPEPEQAQEPEPEQAQEPTCQNQPAPLPAEVATYQKPAMRACARSCQQLRDQNGTSQDGVYWLTGLPSPVVCDFNHDGGGWTLLLTAVSRQGWDPLSVLGRNELSPSLTDNYSILQHANSIRDLGNGDRFAYRIETQAEKGRQRLGGIWFAPRQYSFVDETGTQTEISLVRRFDDWKYKSDGIKRRMPWINTGGLNPYGMYPVLTTASKTQWWGTLVTHHTHTTHNHSPWHNPEGFHSGNVLYWMREDTL